MPHSLETSAPARQRGLADNFTRVALLVASLAAPLSAQDPSPAGQYQFSSVNDSGNSFDGVFHLYRAGSQWAGTVVTTLRAPMPITSVSFDDTLVTVLTAQVGFRWRWRDSVFQGQWRLGNQQGVLNGRKLPREAGDALTPVPCRMPGIADLVRCGTLLVPENRTAAESRRIPLNVVVLPALSASPSGALYTFAGGPGQASTEQADGNAQRYADIRRTHDIVMVDQRGTGLSNGLPCEFASLEERTAALFGAFFPESVTQRCREALSTRADLRYYHSAIAAEDVDAVRAWLGYERLDLYGGSYGTRAALAYIRAHPDRVRTATLRAIMAPSGSLALDNPIDAQRSLELLFARCAADIACNGAFPGLRAEFDSVMARLDRSPAPVRILDRATGDSATVMLTQGVMAGSVRRMLMDATLWYRLPLAIHQSADGDYSVIRAGIEGTVSIAGSLYWGMGLSVVCAEDPPLVRGRNIERETAGSFMGSWQATGMLEICAQWPTSQPPADYAEPVRFSGPALLLSGELDPTTPVRWGETVAASMPSALHLTLPGISHSPFPDCALSIMTAMVTSGTTAGLDTSCVAAMPRPAFQINP